MKKIIAIISIFAVVACEGFLDKFPPGSLSSDSMFADASLAESVVTGVYSNILYDYTNPDLKYNWDAFGSVLDPYSTISSSYSLLMGTSTANESIYLTYWKRFYEGVNRANDVIANISKVPDMSDELKAQRIAECKVLRAWHYYRLNALYRGVPIYLENLSPSEYTKHRSTEEQVWRQVIADCTDAIECDHLPGKYSSSDKDFGRMTKGVAYTMRGKAYMWLKEWELAEADFVEVGKLGYALYQGKYADLFTEANEKCDEMIFSVQMVEQEDHGNALSFLYGNATTTGNGFNHFFGNVDFVNSYQNKNGKPFSWDDYIPGYDNMDPASRSVYFLRDNLTAEEVSELSASGAAMSEYKVSGNEDRIKAAYQDRDPRLAATFITPYSTYVGGSTGTETTYTMRYPFRSLDAGDLQSSEPTKMYYQIRKFVTVGKKYSNINYNPVDIPVFRYADVLLCLAEAINEQGGRMSEAIDKVNMVRSRAGVAGLNTNTATSVIDMDDLRSRIQDEKKWELACEMVLYYDELRWGTWKDDKFAQDNGLQQLWGEPTYRYVWGGDHCYLWAIPVSEREKNPSLTQNPLWN